MANITINDLETNKELDKQALSRVTGGFGFGFWGFPSYGLYRPIVNPYFNPYAYSLQSSWAVRGASFDRGHDNFISFLRS